MDREAGTTTFENAKQFVDSLPVWGVIVNNEKQVQHSNPVARQLGVKEGDLCYASITGRKEVCTWCHLEKAGQAQGSLVSATVRLKFSPQLGLMDDPEGSLKDGHWIQIDQNRSIHFGFVRLLERSLKEQVAQSLKDTIGITPAKSFFEAVDLS
jgi:hypothetical protein